MKTREELDAEWGKFMRTIKANELEIDELQQLIAAERAFVDMEVAAKAIRWAATKLDEAEGWSPAGECIGELANHITSGAIDIGEVLK